MEKLSLKRQCCSAVSLTCVGSWGTYTQSKGVMLQFNKDLFLFSVEEEGNEEVDSHMGADIAAAVWSCGLRPRCSSEGCVQGSAARQVHLNPTEKPNCLRGQPLLLPMYSAQCCVTRFVVFALAVYKAEIYISQI